MRKKIIYYNKVELEALRYCARVMDFGVSLTLTAALNEMLNAYLLLREDKRFRHKLKQLANEADRKATMQKATIMSVMRDRKFFDDYSDKVIDLAEKDITDFRMGIKQMLDENGIKDSELIAQCETASVLLKLSVEHYHVTISKTKEKFKCRLPDSCPEFNAENLTNTWDAVCKLLYSNRQEDVDLNAEQNRILFEKMAKGFCDGQYTKECLQEAQRLHPEFTENDIKVTDETEEQK